MVRSALIITGAFVALSNVASAAPGRAAEDPARPHRTLIVRGLLTDLEPVTVRASIGAVVSCSARDRSLLAGLAPGDHVRMLCVRRDSRWILRRIAAAPDRTVSEPRVEPGSRVRDVPATEPTGNSPVDSRSQTR